MHKRQLEQALHHMRAARNNSDWHGKFTPEIREATVTHRKEFIAKPIELAMAIIETELSRCDRKITKRREKKAKRIPEPQRLPYKDN